MNSLKSPSTTTLLDDIIQFKVVTNKEKISIIGNVTFNSDCCPITCFLSNLSENQSFSETNTASWHVKHFLFWFSTSCRTLGTFFLQRGQHSRQTSFTLKGVTVVPDCSIPFLPFSQSGVVCSVLTWAESFNYSYRLHFPHLTILEMVKCRLKFLRLLV